MSRQVLPLSVVTILLHYYFSPSEHPDCVDNVPSWRANITMLCNLGLLTTRDSVSQFGSTYEVTPRGSVYCEAIRALPLPVQVWTMPEEAQR